MIYEKMKTPSRQDAVRLTRNEKMAMIELAYVATVVSEMTADIPERLAMVENGQERMAQISMDIDSMLNDLRLTIPEDHRMHLHNTAKDYEMRLVPRLTPSSSNVLLQKEEFRTLVDSARAKCMDCSEDQETCKQCKLYHQLLVYLPLDDYMGGFLCPYNGREWGN